MRSLSLSLSPLRLTISLPYSLSFARSRSLCRWRSFSVDGTHRTRVRVRASREGVDGAQVGGCRGGGERTSLEDGDAGAVGVDHGPPCPRWLEGRPRHRGCQGGTGGRGALADERRVRGASWTIIIIIHAGVLQMLSFDGGLAARSGRSVNEVGAGNGWPLSRPVTEGAGGRGGGRRARRKRRVRGETGGERFLNGIVMRVFPVLSSFSNALSTIASFSSFSSLASSSYFSSSFPTLALIYSAARFTPWAHPSAVQWTRAYTLCENSCWKKAYTFMRGYMCVYMYGCM